MEDICILHDFIHPTAPPALQALFGRHGVKELFQAGDLLVKAGDRQPRVHLLFQGNCAFVRLDGRSGSRSCGILPSGGLCGDAPAQRRRPPLVSVMCIDQVSTYSMPSESFLDCLQKDTPLYIKVLEHLLITYNMLYETLLFQSSLNLPQRLAVFLRAYALCVGTSPDMDNMVRLHLKLTHDRIGTLIHASRVSTTLLLNHLGRRGILRRVKNGIEFNACLLDEQFIATELTDPYWTHIREKRSQAQRGTAR